MKFFTDKYFKDKYKNAIEHIISDKITKFMKIPDVMNGKLFYMGNNKPRSWFEAFSTTGYCVKVSEVFIEVMLKTDKLFKDAHTLSIMIDENKFGKCGDGSDNAWHTCVDLNNGYVVDLTIAQFGSQYVNRFIWNKVDWLNEFMSYNDSHDLGFIPKNDLFRLKTYIKYT